jgi:hypothetical protein
MTFMSNSSTVKFKPWFIPFDILSMASFVLVIILSALFLLIIILDKTCHTVPMMLVANSCLVELISGFTLLSVTVFTLQNNLKQIYYQDSLCIFRSYMTDV